MPKHGAALGDGAVVDEGVSEVVPDGLGAQTLKDQNRPPQAPVKHCEDPCARKAGACRILCC